MGNNATGGFALSGKLKACGFHPMALSDSQLLGIARNLNYKIVNVRCYGDSLTTGNDVATSESYPAQLQALFDASGSSGYYTYNFGVGGTGTPEIYDRLSQAVSSSEYASNNILTDFGLPVQGELVPSDPGRLNVAVIDGIGNDLYYGASVSQALANYAALVKTHALNNELVITGTVLPRGAAAGFPSPGGVTQTQFNANASAVNAILRANPGQQYGTAIADDALIMNDPTNGTYFNQGDQVHLTIAGYGVMASNRQSIILGWN